MERRRADVPYAFANLMDPPSPSSGPSSVANSHNGPLFPGGSGPLFPGGGGLGLAAAHQNNIQLATGPLAPPPLLSRKLPPLTFDPNEERDPSTDYAALLQKLKSKERPPALLNRADLSEEMSPTLRHQRDGAQSVLSPGPQRSQSVPRRRRGSLPESASKYMYELSPVNGGGASRRASKAAGGGGGGYESDYYSVGGESQSVPSPSLEPQLRRKGRIKVVVRKRPVPAGEEDVVEVDPPVINVNAQKLRIDLSEYTEAYQYAFDDAFAAHHTNADVYAHCGRALIDTVFEGGSASCFAYGQTGSGKTHTMLGTDTDMGFYLLAAKDIFNRCTEEHKVSVSLFEIYCNSLFDLLNMRSVVIPREDANKRVVICGLTWKDITSVSDLAMWIEKGSEQRRTGSTSANEFSSRSHAVMTISVRNEREKTNGCLKLVDLAGSERAADTAAHDRQTRLEGAEINKSLLALKECIRGLDERKKHIPFRGSKLTEVLRDSFEGNSRTVMIAAVTPAASSVVHTLNTLRYAFRVKGLSIDQNVVPSKQRKSKVAPTRSKSTEPVPPITSTSILAQPLPPLFGAGARSPKPSRIDVSAGVERDSNGRRMRRHRKARSKSEGKPDEEVITAIQTKVGEEIAGLRNEMLGVLNKKDDEITRLNRRNDELEKRLERLLARIERSERTAMGSTAQYDEGSFSNEGSL